MRSFCAQFFIKLFLKAESWKATQKQNKVTGKLTVIHTLDRILYNIKSKSYETL